jgi:hypothetical protein
VTVRREFHQLGEQEHDDKYYTQEIAERLGRVRHGTAPLEQASTIRRAASERLWLAADAVKALELQRPLPDDVLRIVASGEKEDGVAA